MRRLLMGVLAVAAGGIVGLALTEGMVRLLWPEWSDQWKMWRLDPVYARGLRPSVRDAVVHGHSGEFAFRFDTNALGLRMDRELAAAKPSGTERILLVGDSFTFGYGVEQDETFARELQRRFDASGPPTEVINAGFASGFTLDTQYLFTREVAASWEPDAVVVGVCLDNDFEDLTRTLWRIEDGRLAAIEKDNDWVPLLAKKSGLVNLAVKGAVPALRALNEPEDPTRTPSCELPAPVAANVPARSGPPADPSEVLPVPGPGPDAPAERVDWLLRAFARDASSRDYTLTLLLIPSAMEMQRETTPTALATIARRRSLFAKAAQRSGLRVLDPVAPMRRHTCENREALYFERDGHWNAAGHRFIGEWLAAQRLVP